MNGKITLPFIFRRSRNKQSFKVTQISYQNHKVLGNKKSFYHIIKLIIDLQKSRIIINVSGQDTQIFFTLAYIVRDNLGLNTILGFTKSFNAKNCCRICYEDSNSFKEKVKEKCQLFENKEELFTILH